MKLAIISPYPPIKVGISKETELLYFILKDSYDLNIYAFTKLYPSFLYPFKTQKDKSVYEIAKTFSDRVNKGEVEAKHGTEEPKSDSPY